jgi:2-polyprenyl-3-methyl-5-hydroxy-6-metoxy-1,4-benzoquinol methylase
MIHHKVCPLCSSPEISHFLSCNDYFLSKEPFEISKCEECGFKFTQDYPDESDAGHYYESEDYISHSNTNKRATDKAYQFVRKIMLNRKKRIIGRITGLTSGRILDIGSGTGYFLNTMKKSGWDTEGIEKSAKARGYASSRFNLEIIPPEKTEILPDNSFDCITLWHVLEHFYEPDMFMKEISRLLKQDGFCFIAIPNTSSFDASHYGKEWAAYDVPRHLWHFNQSTFFIFAEKNGFRIFSKRNLPFDVFYISILSEKYKGSRIPFLSGAITGLIFSILYLFDKTGSSSTIYILKKSDS